MPHEVIRLLPRTDYDFSGLSAGSSITSMPLGLPDHDLTEWCNGTLVVRFHAASIPSGNTLRFDLKATAPSDQDPAVFFRGPIVATAIADSSAAQGSVFRGAFIGNIAMSGSLFLTATCATGGTFTFTISVDLVLHAIAEAWTPARLSALTLWLDERAQTLGSNGVQTWSDQSGSANDFTQGTGALQPPLDGSINGWMAPRFDSYELDGPNIGAFVTTTAYHVFVVVTPTDFKGTSATITLDDAIIADTNAKWGLFLKHGTTNEAHGYHVDGGGGKEAIVTGLSANVTTLFEWSFDGSTIRLRANSGTVATAGASSMTNVAVPSRLGIGTAGSLHLQGRVGTVVVFNRYLAEWERQSVRAYLSSKYGAPA